MAEVTKEEEKKMPLLCPIAFGNTFSRCYVTAPTAIRFANTYM